MSGIGSLGNIGNIGKRVGAAALGLPGLLLLRGTEKANEAKAAVAGEDSQGSQPESGKKGLSVGNALLRGLLGPAGLLLK